MYWLLPFSGFIVVDMLNGVAVELCQEQRTARTAGTGY